MGFSVGAWILTLNSIVANAVVLTNAPAHTLKKCIQDGMLNIQCDEFRQDDTEKFSYWPPGPYVLPMTRYGCPESSKHGWREGFIRLVWKEPHQIQIVSNSSTIKLFDNNYIPHWPSRNYKLLIPTTPGSLTLYFCYKLRSNSVVDTGVWPDENYSFYKTENDCPPEFENHSTVITVPDLSWWLSDGYLPDFRVNTNTTVGTLELKLCSRRKSSNRSLTGDNKFSDQTNSATDNSSIAPYRNWTHYFLIKNENTSCPIFASTAMLEESVYIAIDQFQNTSSAMMKMIDTLCFYEQTTDEDWLYEKRRKNAYSVTITSLTEGLKESPPDYERYPYLERFALRFQFFGYAYINRWTIVDLGRTISVSAIEITTVKFEQYAVLTGIHQPLGPCINHDFTCFISSGKYSFLHSEAITCLYTEYCRVIRTSLCLVFKRIMEGRYVVLMHQEIGSLFFGDYDQHFFYKVSVFTEVISYDPSEHCNADLGMQNLDIQKNQLSASSSQPEFTPHHSRPYYRGWCPKLDDPRPYIKVIFPAAQTIEGITVYNSQEVIFIQDMIAFVYFGTSLLTLTYSEEVNGTTKAKILGIDSSKLTTEAYTFWFMKAIRAKILMLSFEKEPTSDLTCLRFEIQGCKQSASYDKFYLRERQVPPFEVVGFVSEVYAPNTVFTSITVSDIYQDDQLYKWIIRFPEFHFIKLIFTKLNLIKAKIVPGVTVCNDSIIISSNIADISRSKGRVIDETFYYRRTLSIETKETVIVVSFLTCPVLDVLYRLGGFKAIASYQDIPTCFSIDGMLDWKEGSYEVCRHSSMFISSLSYLGFMFLNTTEQWTIFIPTKIISLRFIDFFVPCKTEENIHFKIKDKGIERSFCNINRPPDIYNSSSDEITVIFNRGSLEQSAGEAVELVQVRIVYTSKEEPGEHLIDHNDKFPKDVNHALHAVAGITYHTYGMSFLSGELVEGKSFPEVSDLSFQDSFASNYRFYAFWWLLDLQNLYVLDYLVLFGAITDKSIIVGRNCQITLSTGVTIYDLQPTGFICDWFEGGCERVINQRGIKSRYVRLQPDCGPYLLALCELQVFANLESAVDEKAMTIPIPMSIAPSTLVNIDGEWGEWSSWSYVCFCNEKQYRYRLCNDPVPAFRGKYCTGENISYRACRIEATACKDYKENNYPTKEQNYCTRISTVNKTWSAWSKWSTCSAKCGLGVQSRQRECNAVETQGIKPQCVGDSSERKSCIGNDTCLVCAETFSKCYSIITKYTNWKQAQLECFMRNMTLVSILSLSEQRFVKYLLRQRRSSDRLPINYFNADFYVHIGLQTRLDSKYDTPIWDNGRYASYFTAWKMNDTFSKACTRMDFRYLDEDNTWESEDCEEQLTEYIMCESQRGFDIVPVVKGLRVWKDDGKQMIPEQIPSAEYKGQLNVTIAGENCNASYCRDYFSWGYLICYKSDGTYEECSVNLPPVENGTTYSKYLGKLNKTFSGKACQSWTSTIPHHHELHGDLFKGESILEAANNCRDLGDIGFLWCFTEDPDTRWEPCLLKELKAERQCVRKHEYSGKKNTTLTGKTCMRWDKQVELIKDSLWSEINLTHAENYCRNLFNFGFIWCYIDSTYQAEVWEPCIPDETRQDERRKNISIQSRDMFSCSDGTKIQTNLRCNGIFECDDKSDETDCLDMFDAHVMMPDGRGNMSINLLNLEKGSFFRCGTGEWISAVAKCDSVIDCLDASDEINCILLTTELNGCTIEQFQCDDGDCIHISQVCNFVEDCLDGSDEYCDLDACSPLTEYSCGNGQCIPKSQRCDAVKQCPDGSDENECDTCQSGVFHCDISRCIPMRLLCDNFTHCQDKTDELNCESGVYTSCQHVWNAGFRKTGHYRIGNIQAYCSFDNVYEDGSILTILHLDIYFETDILTFFHEHIPLFDMIYTKGIFYNIPSTIGESTANFLIFNQVNTTCTQQVMIRCVPSFELFDQYDNDKEYDCSCGLVNYDIFRDQDKPRSIDSCPVISYMNLTLSSKPLLNSTDVKYEFSSFYQLRSLIFHDHPTPDRLIEARSAVCKHDFMPTDNDFLCNINGQHIPDFERCIYDIDSSGFPTGCSDGSHIMNCESFDCPDSMLKCPESYCIPQVFLCDGIQQCPGGEDEEGCRCKQTNDEILIIYDAVSTEGPNFARFARQFYNRTNIVRLLEYKATRPLHLFNIEDILLEVEDTELNLSPNIEEAFSCNYKLFAKELLNSIHFTNDGIKGVIVVQNSEISIDVFQSIAESIADSTENFRLYRVSQYLNTVFSAGSNMGVYNFTDVRVRRWKTLDDIGAKYFSDLCELSSVIHCPNRYKCSSSKSCIPMEQVCDGRKQCLHGDDELLCDFNCPVDCKCAGYFANCSATNFKPNMLYTVPKNSRHLDFSFNNQLHSFFEHEMMINFTKLSILNVSGCGIETLSKYSFLRLRNLQTLDLGFNKISVLPNYVFESLVHLKNLNLRGNSDLSVIEQHALNSLFMIRDLHLADAKIFKILSGTFEGLNLKTLDLSNNDIREIDDYAFRESFIENINFDGNSIEHFKKEIFTGLVNLKILKTPAFKFCCIRPNYVPEQNCYPKKDEFSSCDDLMRHSGLQFMIWLIGIMALIGNVLSVIYRIKYDRDRLKLGYGIFVTNLAVADFLMAVYLMIIAIADSAFRKRYIYVDDYWRHSIWCNIAGILSTTSSEASVLFLCFITLDRLLVIKYPFGGVRITTKAATVCAGCAWLFSVFVAILPVAYIGYFNNEFYSKSGVCIALPLTRDRPPGWAYSLALFVCLNFITFVLVAVGQLSIFVEIRKSTGIATSAATSRKRDLKVARNLLLVVATDFLCWFPIGVMGMLALSGHPVSGEVYAWAAVFILPVNSALNPLLYTLSAIIGAKSFNPRAEEQSFIKITQDIGQNAIKCLTAGHHISKKLYPTFQKLSTLNLAEMEISWKDIIKIALKAACILDTLHCSSLGIQPFDENSVFIEVVDRKLSGNIRIQGSPFVSLTAEDKEKNIRQFGMILRRLIAAKVRQG